MNEKTRFVILFWTIMLIGSLCFAEKGVNLVVNGDFEDPENPTKGWTLDWDWNGSSVNANNLKNVTILPKDGLKKNVLRLEHHNKEAPFLSPVVPFEYGKTYEISFDVKINKGAGERIYIAGYKWKPGVRPYENPHTGDLRKIYQGKNIAGIGTAWKRISIKFPGSSYDDLSPLAKQSLQPTRVIGLYCVMVEDENPVPGEAVFIDNLIIKEL